MKIISVPAINALGLKGPEEMGEKVLTELGIDAVSSQDSSQNGLGHAKVLDIDNSDVEKSEKIIYEKAKSVFSSGEKVVFVGGDHSISYSTVRAFNDINDKAFLVVFDAHADCDIANKEPTHEEWLRATIESGFDPSRIVLVGARKMWDVEKQFLEENGVRVFSGVEGVFKYVKENAGKNIYVSVDIDVLDPEFAPGVSYTESNGVSSEALLFLLGELFSLDVKALDVVEVVPKKDIDGKTVKVAANIIKLASQKF
jgi:arginase family enzyme